VRRRILLVEDEHNMVVLLTDRLVASGYDVTSATTGPKAVEMALGRPFDLLLLDILLPGQDGLSVCRELRRRGVTTPILMLTALGEIVDKVVGLRTGADDYLTKPFEAVELLARIEALLRRASPLGPGLVGIPDPYRFGDVEVRFREVEVLRQGEPVHLSARMFELLRFFIQRRGETLSRNELLDAVWGRDAMPSERTVDVHVAWLRQRLEIRPSRPQFLRTIRGFGYRFVG
jgi:DNA-binding response OmpR family regulator